MGKGSKRRPGDWEAYKNNWQTIFGDKENDQCQETRDRSTTADAPDAWESPPEADAASSTENTPTNQERK